jgi:lipopolysaccharide/colanic/teichoic acid biosynthesis glycosyltransferase
MKRVFDILFSLTVLILLFPVLIIIGIFIKLDSKGGIFFRQKRVGKDSKEFSIIKFRTMKVGADRNGLLTVGEKDPRITSVGYYLRRYKLDELPQFINVLKGEMSVIGPRPEVRKYVELYSDEQKKILSVKPGITDYSSIEYSDESEILSHYADADDAYVKIIMPRKIEKSLSYIRTKSFSGDLKILWLTFRKILFKSSSGKVNRQDE